MHIFLRSLRGRPRRVSKHRAPPPTDQSSPINDCKQSPAGNRCTLYFCDSSVIVISSRIASSATLALKSPSHRFQENDCRAVDEWVFRFVISDHLCHRLIHINDWSEFTRPPRFRSQLQIATYTVTNFDLPPPYHRDI